MYKPLVSILISTYNGEKYIEETIFSIKQQTYSNIEIIVVDDKSTDDTLCLLEKLENIIVLKNLTNKGLNKSLNDSLPSCNGKYIIFFGHDDLMLPKRIEKQVSFMEKNRCLASFGNSYYMFENERSEKIIITNNFKSLLFNRIKNTFFLFMLDLQFNSNSMIVQRQIVEEVKGFETWFRNYGESYLYYKIALHGQIMYQDEVLSYYRKHNRNMTLELNEKKVSKNNKINVMNTFYKNYQFKNKFFYRSIMNITITLKKIL